MTSTASAQRSASDLGLGTVPLAGFGAPCSNRTFEDVVLAAVQAGFGYLDTAPMYGSGRGEVTLGHIIRTHGLRNKITLSTKVGRLLRRKGAGTDEQFYGVTEWHGGFPFDQVYDYSYDGVMRSVEDSMQRFGLDQFDILHIHDIGSVNHAENAPKYWRQLTTGGGLKALDELRSQGVAGGIGVGVNETSVILDLLGEFDLNYCLLAGRYTLIDHTALNNFFPIVQERGVKVIAAGVFNSGILGTGVRKAHGSFNYAAPSADVVQRVGLVEDICEAHDVALPEAALQFVTAHPAVHALLLGCKSVAEVEQNARAYSRKAPTAFWADLRAAGLVPEEAPLPV